MASNGGKVKVLHLVESGGMYGAENVILNLSLEMQQSGRYEPIVGCIIQERGEVPALCEAARNRGIRTELFNIKNALLPFHYIHFLRRLKAIRPDVIHSHGYKASVYAYPAGKLLRIPVTATCHLWYVDDQSPRKMRLLIRLEKALYRRFPMVFAVSPAIRDVLLAAGVSESCAQLVNNGILLRTSKASGAADAKLIAGRFGITPSDICVVNAGRLTHQKSQKTIVDAAKLLRGGEKSYKFIIAGDGELRDELAQHIRNEGLSDTVRLVGFVDPITELLRIADVFVLPSRDEGMPISLLEAVAAKVPVVATNVGAIESIVQDKVSGLLIRPDSPASLAAAVEHIVDHPEFSKSLTVRAYELLKSNYSSAAMFNAYDHYYRMMLGNR